MLTVIIDYDVITPMNLIKEVIALGCFCTWENFSTDFYELSVWGCNMAEVEKILAPYV